MLYEFSAFLPFCSTTCVLYVKLQWLFPGTLVEDDETVSNNEKVR